MEGKNGVALSLCAFLNLKEAVKTILALMTRRGDDPTFVIDPNVFLLSPTQCAFITTIAPPNRGAGGGGRQLTYGDSGAGEAILGRRGSFAREGEFTRESVVLQLANYRFTPDGRIQIMRGPFHSVFLNVRER